MNRPPRNILTTEDLLRDALDHIARTARQSRSQTRRIRWIAERAELALRGRPYVEDELNLPPKVDREATILRRAIAQAINYPDDWNTQLVPNEQTAIGLVNVWALRDPPHTYGMAIEFGEAWTRWPIELVCNPDMPRGALRAKTISENRTLLRINEQEPEHGQH